MIWYLNSILDLNLSSAKDFQNLYGDLVYKLKKIVGSNNFSAQFIKINSHYKKIGYNINVLQQTACLVVNPTLLSSLIACRWVRLQTLWRFWLKDLSIDVMVGAWCFGCCQAQPGLPVGFLLLRYSVLFTVESLSDALISKGSFMQAKLLCVLVYIWARVGLARREAGLGPPVGSFCWPFRGGASFVDHFCYFGLVFVMLLWASVYWCLVVTCWERADL